MELIKIQVTVNGSKEILDVPPNLSLLNMLRENLALTGTKSGCEAGECGACTVLLEGEPVNSCMVLAVECSGLSVETIEGLSEKEAMKKLQNAFIDLNAIQCGFCTPGMLISAFALLKRNPDSSDEEIRMALLGNLCRCTGYERIIDAVKKAARN
ncbi:MAG: (2Fe-2S)-binding protein [Pelolinea sp.]|nr:(2Fe-2S)-binding protein [Pelolinea sp.]